MKKYNIDKIRNGLVSIANVFVKTTSPTISKANKRASAELAAKAGAKKGNARVRHDLFQRDGTVIGQLTSYQVSFRKSMRRDEDHYAQELPINAVTKAIEVPLSQLERKIEIRDEFYAKFESAKVRLAEDYTVLRDIGKEACGEFEADLVWPSTARFCNSWTLTMDYTRNNFLPRNSRDEAILSEALNIAEASEEESLIKMAEGSVGNLLGSLEDLLQKTLPTITEGERLGQSRFDKLKSAYNAIDSNYKRYFDTGAIERIDDLLGQLHEVGSIQRSDLADQDDRNAVAKKVKAVQEANNLALEELGL